MAEVSFKMVATLSEPWDSSCAEANLTHMLWCRALGKFSLHKRTRFRKHQVTQHVPASSTLGSQSFRNLAVTCRLDMFNTGNLGSGSWWWRHLYFGFCPASPSYSSPELNESLPLQPLQVISRQPETLKENSLMLMNSVAMPCRIKIAQGITNARQNSVWLLLLWSVCVVWLVWNFLRNGETTGVSLRDGKSIPLRSHLPLSHST